MAEQMCDGRLIISQDEARRIIERIEKTEGMLNYHKAINRGFVEENNRLREQLRADQNIQILKISKETLEIQMGRRR